MVFGKNASFTIAGGIIGRGRRICQATDRKLLFKCIMAPPGPIVPRPVKPGDFDFASVPASVPATSRRPKADSGLNWCRVGHGVNDRKI